MTLPSFAYAGIPYHVFGVRAGAAAVISAWTFLAMPRSGSCILAIAASSSVFPSALAASALSSRTRSRAAAFSSALNPVDAVGFALVRFARFCVLLVAVLVGAIRRAPVRELTPSGDVLAMLSVKAFRRPRRLGLAKLGILFALLLGPISRSSLARGCRSQGGPVLRETRPTIRLHGHRSLRLRTEERLHVPTVTARPGPLAAPIFGDRQRCEHCDQADRPQQRPDHEVRGGMTE